MKQEGSTCIIPAQKSAKEIIKYVKDSAKEVYGYAKDEWKLWKITKEKGRDSNEFREFLRNAFQSNPIPDSMEKACNCNKNSASLVYKSNWGKTIKATSPLGFIPIISWPLGAAAIPLYAYFGFRAQEKKVPSCVSDLPIKKFDANWVGLSEIDSIENVKEIESVNVPNNNLREFPDISKLEKLSYMNLDHNVIPPFTCGTMKVKKSNRKFYADELRSIRDCMNEGNELRYGRKLSLLGYSRAE